MPRSLDAPLSPHEETALRRVALGAARPADVAPRDLMRLRTLELVEDADGLLRLTSVGRQRYGLLSRPGAAPTRRTADAGHD